jgi:hypothetical protein
LEAVNNSAFSVCDSDDLPCSKFHFKLGDASVAEGSVDSTVDPVKQRPIIVEIYVLMEGKSTEHQWGECRL